MRTICNVRSNDFMYIFNKIGLIHVLYVKVTSIDLRWNRNGTNVKASLFSDYLHWAANQRRLKALIDLKYLLCF